MHFGELDKVCWGHSWGLHKQPRHLSWCSPMVQTLYATPKACGSWFPFYDYELFSSCLFQIEEVVDTIEEQLKQLEAERAELTAFQVTQGTVAWARA